MFDDPVKMNFIIILAYASLQIITLFATKYVLSVLGFQYPMVFQGWQTLVGFLVFQLLSSMPRKKPFVTIASLDRPGLVSLLPSFILFTFSIISGSKALASIPVLVFISVTNILPALIQLFDLVSSDPVALIPAGAMRKKVASLIVLITGASLCFLSPEDLSSRTDPSVNVSAYFALAVHLSCGFALTLHSRIADARFTMLDKQLYSYGFSLIVLAPASLYLEEAFEALHFQHRRQIRFIFGSVLCAVSGALLYLLQSRIKDKESFGRVHHSGLVIAAVLSLTVFPTDLPWWAWALATINLVFAPMVPTHIKPEDNFMTSGEGNCKTVAGTIGFKSLPTFDV